MSRTYVAAALVAFGCGCSGAVNAPVVCHDKSPTAAEPDQQKPTSTTPDDCEQKIETQAGNCPPGAWFCADN